MRRMNGAISSLRWLLWLQGFGIAIPILLPAAADEPSRTRRVAREELELAMSLHGDYDITKTTNVARLQVETLLRLVRTAQEADSTRQPLFISHQDWFVVFLKVAGITADAAPKFAKLAYQHGQDVLVEQRPERVIHHIKSGYPPQTAMNVTIYWPESRPGPDRYSYTDSLSIPRLQVTDHRVITYRLLDFGDIILLDEIQGLTGRPITGIMGALFRLIGEGRIVQTRLAISKDGLQILRGKARKSFVKMSRTVTIHPDGRAEKGLPDDRMDLRAIESRLKETIEIEYHPI